MCELNLLGPAIAKISGVSAMTDVTGFGLAGHLVEMCLGATLNAKIEVAALPLLPKAKSYLEMGCIPGGTHRNYESYGEHLPILTDMQKGIICDPQTSGGLLISVSVEAEQTLIKLLADNGIPTQCVGTLTDKPQSTLVELI